MDLFKSLVWDNIVKAVLAQIFVEVPLLGWGPFGVVITFAFMRYSEFLYRGIDTFVDVKGIAFKNEVLKKQYDSVSSQLKIIAIDYGVESTQFKTAHNWNRENLAKFVKFDPDSKLPF